jgi:hypothetical protein
MTQTKHLLDEADIGSGEQEDTDRKAIDRQLGVKPDKPEPDKQDKQQGRDRPAEKDRLKDTEQETAAGHILRTGLPPGVEEEDADAQDPGSRTPKAPPTDNRT